MIRKTVTVLNIALLGMVCYLYGNYQGQQVQKQVDNTMAIRYAVLQAMNYEGNQ